MARIRSIKPEIWMSPQVMNLSKDARLLFIGLITQADDEGRGTADPRRVKAAIFGGDDETSSNVRRMLDEIAGQRLIVLYHDDSHGDLYALPSWKQHQKIDRPGKSAYPPPSDQRALVEDSSSIRRGSEGSDRIGSSGSEGSEGADLARARVSSERANPLEGNGRSGLIDHGDRLTQQSADACSGLDAWRDAGCDPEAMETWLAHLSQLSPPKQLSGSSRIHAAQILRGMGDGETQRVAVKTAAANGWKSLRQSDGKQAAANLPAKRMRTAHEIAALYPEDAA